MERPLPRLDRIQTFLDGGGRDRETWAWLQAGNPRAAVTQYQSEPHWMRIGARAEYRHCVERALALTDAEPRSAPVDILPLWTGDNEDALPGPHWYATHAVVLDGDLAAPWEISPVYDDADPRFERRLNVHTLRWRVAAVVDVSSYGRSIELPYRGKTYGVVVREMLRAERVVARPGAPVPRPQRDVPMWCQWHRFRVEGVEDELEAQLRARWITTNEEGELIEPPE